MLNQVEPFCQLFGTVNAEPLQTVLLGFCFLVNVDPVQTVLSGFYSATINAEPARTFSSALWNSQC